MSLGQWLDDAHAHAEQAAAKISSDGIAVNDLLAAFYARDRAWMSLARIADLIRGARAPKPLGLAAATRQLTDRTATPIRLISVAAHAAVLRPRTAADVRLSASGPAARLIIDGADAIAVAADIVATHVEPRTENERALRLRPDSDPAALALSRNRHLTMVGAALAAGVERDEAAGELARLGHAWIRVDQALVHSSSQAPAYLGRSETEQLRQWTTGPFPAMFTAHTHAAPAVLLRQVEPATAVERSTGPRVVAAYTDVVRAVADVSSAAKRDPQQLTAALLSACARIGFGVEVLAGRMAGDDEPSPQAVAKAMRWKNIAKALTHVRDSSDDAFAVYAREANLAADWIRDQTRLWPASTAELPDSLEPLQRLLGGLAAQSVEPWRQALVDGRILTAVEGLSESHHNGIRRAEMTWSKASPLDPQGRAVLHRLADAAEAHPAWSSAAHAQTVQLRTEEAAAGHGPHADRLQERRKRLRLAQRVSNDAAHAQRAAADTHARLQLWRSDRDYTDEPPRTVNQRAVRRQVDALEQDLARQQQRWEILRGNAAHLAQAAGVPDGQDPGEVLQQLRDDWSGAIEAAVAKDIEAAANNRSGNEDPARTVATNTAIDNATLSVDGFRRDPRTRSAGAFYADPDPDADTKRRARRCDGPENTL